MGITGLLKKLSPVTKSSHISEFKGKTIAVDGYCWLHRAVYGCCIELCTNVETNRWLTYITSWIDMLLSYNIKVYMIFDGAALPSKGGTESNRKELREENLEKGLNYLNSNDRENAQRYLSRAVNVTPLMASRLINLLKKIRPDVICLVAPYEADAQLAFLSINNIVDSVISEDSDLIPFGCKDIIFKLDQKSGKLLLLSLFL